MEIEQGAIKGEKFTGYEGPENGPFACSNCRYFEGGSCGQKTMMEKSQLPKNENGRPIVSPAGCCEFIERVGSGTKKSGRHWMVGKKAE